MAINIGDRIEVIGVEAGFEHSYFAGRVVGIHGELYEVEYEELSQTKDGPLLRELIESEQIRPYPPVIEDDDFEEGSKVDVWYHGGWWEGEINAVFYNHNNQKRYEVYFDYMKPYKKYSDYKPTNVRWHQSWKVVNNRSVWSREGEVHSGSGSDSGSGNEVFSEDEDVVVEIFSGSDSDSDYFRW